MQSVKPLIITRRICLLGDHIYNPHSLVGVIYMLVFAVHKKTLRYTMSGYLSSI